MGQGQGFYLLFCVFFIIYFLAKFVSFFASFFIFFFPRDFSISGGRRFQSEKFNILVSSKYSFVWVQNAEKKGTACREGVRV